MTRRSVIIALTVLALLVLTVSPALATHDHFIVTPNGNCHQVAQGQTAIPEVKDEEGRLLYGGHRYHYNVHKGAAADGTLGNSEVGVFKDTCPVVPTP